MLHAWEKHGYESAQDEFRSRYDKKHRSATRDEPTFRRVVRGKLEFIRMVRGGGSPLCQQLFDKYFELTRQSPLDGVFVLECDATHIQGTGFLLKGYGLVSCAHVLGPKTAAYSADARARLPVNVVYRNDDLDVAILAFDSHIAHSLRRGNPASMSRGDSITLMGFPNYNWGNPVQVTPGVISGTVIRHATQRFTITAPIVKGNSGGPLLNARGEVIGIAVTGLEAPKLIAESEYGVIWIDVLDSVVRDELLRHLGALLQRLVTTRP
jgi:RNA-directed DNA polymerase